MQLLELDWSRFLHHFDGKGQIWSWIGDGLTKCETLKPQFICLRQPQDSILYIFLFDVNI